MESLYLAYCCLLAASLASQDFSHDIMPAGRSPELGGYMVRASGRFKDLILLDSLSELKVRVGSDGHLRVTLMTSTARLTDWRPGRVVAATNLSHVDRDGSVSQRPLLARIRTVEKIDHETFKVLLDHSRALEMVASGEIHMQYSPPEPSTYQRTILDETSAGTFRPDLAEGSAGRNEDIISINCDHRTPLVLSTPQDENPPHVVFGEQANISSDYYFKLFPSCETQRIHHSFDFIKKIPDSGLQGSDVLQTQMTINVAIAGELEVDFRSQGGIETRHLISSSPNRVLRRMKVVSVEGLPSLEIVTSYSTTSWLQVYATSSGAMHYHGDYNTSGDVVIKSETRNRALPRISVDYMGWRTVLSSTEGQGHSSFYINVSIFNEVQVQTYLQWRDLPSTVFSLTDFKISIQPTVSLRSTRTDSSFCYDVDLNVIGQVEKGCGRQEPAEPCSLLRALPKKPEGTQHLGSAQMKLFCSADCEEDTEAGVFKNTACGEPSTRITRDDDRFSRMTTVSSELLEFRCLESTPAPCGDAGSPCSNPEKNQKPCAARVMSLTTARYLNSLAQLAHIEWPQSHVVVVKAWEDLDSDFLRDNQSLHHEGRELKLTLQRQDREKSSVSELERLAQLAHCAGFPYAAVMGELVAVCVEDDLSPEVHRHKRAVSDDSTDLYQRTFDILIESINASSIPVSGTLTPLAVGLSDPPGNPEQVLGPPLENSAVQESLFQYAFPDLTFAPEGSAGSLCEKPPRPCQTTCSVVSSKEPGEWCQNRKVTPRMAFRLRRFAALVQRKITALGLTNVEWGTFRSATTYSARSMAVSLSPGPQLTSDLLASLAVEAGFDHVRRPFANNLELSVVRQEGYRSRLVAFPSTSLLAVLPPSPDYDMPQPAPFSLETDSQVPLFDGHDTSRRLSPNFRMRDFMYPGYRFFRLDPILLTCLEMTTGSLPAAPLVLAQWGYRPGPENRVNLNSRNREERSAFQEGRAVYLTAPSGVTLLSMATTVASLCTPYILRINRKLGLGCHSNKLYVDIRLKTLEDIDNKRYADVWNVDNPTLHAALSDVVSQMAKGGPIIAPTNKERACKAANFEEQNSYFSFSIGRLCIFGAGGQCSDTIKQRTEAVEMLSTTLTTILGRRLKSSTISQLATACLVTPCGGCLGAGDVWREKLSHCVALVKLYTTGVSAPWGEARDVAAFFNTEHPNSTVHSLACHHGSVCVENTQLYAVMQTILMAKYKPKNGSNQEELLFGTDNPTPLPEIIQQEMAHIVAGKVKVYMERVADLGVLKDTIKVLMVYNKLVTDVEFHFADDNLKDRLLPRLYRHLDSWALSTCPKWSRFAAAPFSLHVIHGSRRKRSAERSRGRNLVKEAHLNWEHDWISQFN